MSTDSIDAGRATPQPSPAGDDDALPVLDLSLMDPAVQSCPWEFYRQLHERCPTYRLPENGVFVVTGYDDLRRLLNDPAQLSNTTNVTSTIQNEIATRYYGRIAERGWRHVKALQRADPPLHNRHRSLLNRVFTPKTVRDLAPSIDAVAHELIDRFIERGRVEFFSEFAVPLPGIIIAEQIGLPRSELATFKRWADAMLSIATRKLTPDEADAIADEELEAQHYLADVFEQRRREPRNDLISMLVHAHEETGEEPLDAYELQSLMHQLITGGFETTTSGIAHAMWLLLRHPDQLAELRADRSLMKQFIEEALRVESPVQGLGRRAVVDVPTSGATIPAGSSVIVRYGAANRDPAQFPEPERFDIHRPNSATHLAFGLGPHYCIGAALARQEMASAFHALLDRTDDWALAEPLDDPVHHPSLYFLPMKELHLSFRAR